MENILLLLGKKKQKTQQQQNLLFHLPTCNCSMYSKYLPFLLIFLSFGKCYSYSSHRDNKEATFISMPSDVYCLNLVCALPSDRLYEDLRSRRCDTDIREINEMTW